MQFSNPAAEFTYIRTYSRWLEAQKRRETWPESIDRYITFLKKHTGSKVPDGLLDNIKQMMLNQEVVGSMRALWSAGPALERDSLTSFNCAFVGIDDIRAFSEILYILMCGTGVGFRVLKSDVEKLPAIPKEIRAPFSVWDNAWVIDDSRTGWANSLLHLISSLYRGKDIEMDYSLIRPSGAKLKTMGGTASGPGPLKDLHNFVRNTFRQAVGRRLTAIECHDICNMIADIVVVGGVRRSSEISLSDLDDDDMRTAKVGDYPAYRGMANNSAVYFDAPSEDVFWREWASLRESGTGERGIFNLKGARDNAPSRRLSYLIEGINPCVTADTWVLTSKGARQVQSLIGKRTQIVVNGATYSSDGFFYTGTKPVFTVKTDKGFSLNATEDHKFLVRSYKSSKIERTEWRPLKDIVVGDNLVLHKHQGFSWVGDGSVEEGWLVGMLLGDGNITKAGSANLDFWGDHKYEQAAYAVSAVTNNLRVRSDFGTGTADRVVKRVGCMSLGRYADKFGINNESKIFNDELEKMSSDFYIGFARGWFDADGTVAGSQLKGISVRVSCVDVVNLYRLQRMLARLGIISKVYTNRQPKGFRTLPDGKGGYKDYYCKEANELIISNSNLVLFCELIGFNQKDKQLKLERLLSDYKRNVNKEQFVTTVTEISPIGELAVYDCQVPNINAFDANGVYAHNCGEIPLRKNGLCNLTEVIIRPTDTLQSLTSKVEAVTWLGAIQSTLTHFPYLRDEWRQNAEDERLLGVSLTGQMDAPHLITKQNLKHLKQVALFTAKEASEALGINMPAAITCVKPSGTVSIVTDASPGMHPRFAKFYIRRIRISATDPLYYMMRDQGFHFTPEVGQRPQDQPYPHTWDQSQVRTWVCEFPSKAPEGAITRHDVTALDQLEHYKLLSTHWAEHSVSVTIYVEPDEWQTVGQWVLDNWDCINGISFLNKTDHVYELAPYEEITEEQYNELLAATPTIDYSMLGFYEKDDNTTGAHELACVGGACEIV